MAGVTKDWMRVRTPLHSGQRGILSALSFLLPFLVWVFFAYCPGLWKISYELKTSTDLRSDQFQTIYRVGYVMEKKQFLDFQEHVRSYNLAVNSFRSGSDNLESEEFSKSLKMSTRENKKALRKIYPVALESGLLKETQSIDDKAIYELWKKLALGDIKPSSLGLSEENLEITQKNWKILKATCGDSYDKETFPKEPLYQLIPVGKKAVGRPSYLPAPHETFQAAVDLWNNKADSIVQRYFDSVRIVFYGFLIACIIGLPLGLIAGTFDFFSRLIEPFVDFFRYLPAPAFGTLLVFLLGSHDAPKIALVFLGTVCQAVLMTANTTRQLEGSLLDAAQTLGAKKKSLIFKVVIPGVKHNLYNDLRILLGWAWTWLVIAELMGVKSGLTEVIDTQGRRFNFDIVYAVILAIGLTGFLTDQLLVRLYPTLFPWASSEGKNFRGLFAKIFSKKSKPI